MDDTSAIDDALDLVGPRLKNVRVQRGITLTDVSERTGISTSTLSRLENGQRRPSLELLLPLAQAYRVPLDELVGAPEVGDPRIRLKPRQVSGRTVLPLARGPHGVQAWKIIIPKGQSTPAPGSTSASRPTPGEGGQRCGRAEGPVTVSATDPSGNRNGYEMRTRSHMPCSTCGAPVK